MLYINQKIQIPVKEFSFQFARSSGPGGQNVNKVNSKAQLSWKIDNSKSIDDQTKTLIHEKLSTKISKEGYLILSSERYRDQGRNVADCMQKLTELLVAVLKTNKPRKATKPSRGQKEKRLQDKKANSQKKSSRRQSITFH